MKNKLPLIILAFIIHGLIADLHADTRSVFTQKPNDPEAYFFTPENYNIRADGRTDVSDALQNAINQVKTEKNFGILFIPEGKYLISRTIYVPPAVRLIGYGKNRPEIILAKNSPGYQQEVRNDPGRANYMIWFTGNMPSDEVPPRDAGAGTFYSAVSNINFRIEDGNPHAVALRTHYAQHGYVSHSVINAGNGKAGLFDVGNEMENVRFIGGDYGIYTRRTSPGWPMMIVDTYFENQRKAAIQTNEGGLAIVNIHVKNVPVAIEMVENKIDRLFIENSFFEDVKEAGIVVSVENNTLSQLNMINITCRNVPVIVKFLQSGRKVEVSDRIYNVKDFTYGLVMDDMTDNSTFRTISDIEPLRRFPSVPGRHIPSLPPMETWVNIRELGAAGDGETDDTRVFREAIAKHKNIYVPQGWYRFTETVKMAPGTRLIGLHPFATQFLVNESEPAFSGFGAPKAIIESSEGGDDILTGIGLNTGAYNYRAVGAKWMAGEKSLLNDIKFVGGHGTMRRPGVAAPPRAQTGRTGPNISSPGNPVYARGMDLAWDNQYWSLWVTNNGGGILKNIWTANTYASSGLYVSNTSTPGRIYAMSLEHHVRNEARFHNVSNWRMYAFQLEEEGLEGKDCMMVEISHCSDLMFANTWMYRVIRVSTPQPIGFRIWNSENIEFRNMHNYTQKLQVIEFPLYDVNREIPIYAWDFARLNITGKEESNLTFSNTPGKVQRLVSGFEFATGATSDSKGNVYFSEHRMRRVYKWCAENNSLSMISDYPWAPFSLATDTKDNLIVVFRYDPQPGLLINGVQETVKTLPDDNPMYSGWGNSGWAAWAYSVDPDNPDETIALLPRVDRSRINRVEKVIYPASRWRFDFDRAIVYRPDSAFVAPDGVTILPETYDLGRNAALTSARPGQTIFVSDENLKKIVELDVQQDGSLANMREVHPRGEYSTVTDRNGNLYVTDGQIFVYDRDGNEINRINVPERPISITIGGKNHDTLFITTRTSLFGVKI